MEYRLNDIKKAFEKPGALGYLEPAVEEARQEFFVYNEEKRQRRGWVEDKVILIDTFIQWLIEWYSKGYEVFADNGINDDPKEPRQIKRIIVHYTHLPEETLIKEDLDILSLRLSVIQMWNIYLAIYNNPKSILKYQKPLFFGHTFPPGHLLAGMQHAIGYHGLIKNGEYLPTLTYNQHGYHASDKILIDGSSINGSSIGICICDPVETKYPTESSLNILAIVSSAICRHYNIYPGHNTLLGHNESQIRFGTNTNGFITTCPGPRFLTDENGNGGWKQLWLQRTQDQYSKT